MSKSKQQISAALRELRLVPFFNGTNRQPTKAMTASARFCLSVCLSVSLSLMLSLFLLVYEHALRSFIIFLLHVCVNKQYRSRDICYMEIHIYLDFVVFSF